MNGWKGIKTQIKEVKLLEYKEQLDIKQQQFLERELKSIVETTAEVNMNKSKIGRDVREFSLWLTNNFGSSERFTDFLSSLELHSGDDQELITFRNEYKKALPINMNYRHYLNWNNYTVYKKPVLIIAAFQTYYANLPKKEGITLVFRGVIAKAQKSKRRKEADAGTIEEYVHKKRIMVNPVLRWLILNGKKFRNGLITRFIKEGNRFRPVVQKGTPKEIVEQYQFIHPYGFKYEGQHQLSAFRGKAEMQSIKKSRSKRIEAFEDKQGNDLTKIRDYMLFNHKCDLFKGFKIDSREYNRAMTVAFHLLRQKGFDGFSELIENNDPINQALVKKMGTTFDKKFEKAIKTYRSEMREQ